MTIHRPVRFGRLWFNAWGPQFDTSNPMLGFAIDASREWSTSPGVRGAIRFDLRVEILRVEIAVACGSYQRTR